MEEQKSPNQLLDDTLLFFNGINYQMGSPFVAQKLKPILNVTELKIWYILNKLVEDGYLHKTVANARHDYFYTISFNGSVFIENGGYIAKSIRDAFEHNRLEKLEISQMESQKSMTRLTMIIAFGTLVAAVYYLYFLIQDLCWCEFVWQKHP